MTATSSVFLRNELLLGAETVSLLAQQHVILFGTGGVGSWCAEGLIRSGIGHLTIVDPDNVCQSNINRQLMATTETVGQPKVDVLRERLLSINPEADIVALRKTFSKETAEEFQLDSYDFIIDAIDSLKDKAQLILEACNTRAVFFSSMGAALKMDPTRIQVAEFWKVEGDPLARALRRKFKSLGQYPSRKFLCVYSSEQLANLGQATPEAEQPSLFNKPQINGSLVNITAVFGFNLSALVMQRVVSNDK